MSGRNNGTATGSRSANRSNGNRSTGNAAPPAANWDLAALSVDLSKFEYGVGRPLYDLLGIAGALVPVNTVDDPMEGSFFEVRDELKQGQCAYVRGEYDGRETMTLAVRTSADGMVYAGLYYDGDGNIQTEDLQLCAVQTNRDFELELDGGHVIEIEEGKQMIKALPAKYVKKLKKAA